MSYAHTSFSQLKTQLAARLGDSNKTFWIDDELRILLKESLRTYGLLSGFWRERGQFSTTAGVAFYDLPTQLSDNLLTYSVTDREIIQALQFHLLESASTQASWPGTAQFTYSQVTSAIQRRLNQFLSDTGVVVNRSIDSTSTKNSRRSVPDTVIDVRRVAWIESNVYTHLWEEDERALTASNMAWSTARDAPAAYSVMAIRPITLQIAPPPSAAGTVELLTVDTGPTLTPSSAATVLGIPDDLTPAVKWGALADLLAQDGEGRDLERAQFAEKRYQQYVALARLLPVIVHSMINCTPVWTCAVQELDAANPQWQNISGTPVDIAVASQNLIALSPVPNNATTTVTLDVVERTPMPANDSAQVQIGREELEAIIDYAEHLALFKVGGALFMATEHVANNFLLQAITYNQRISASARYLFTAQAQSEREKLPRPRRLVAQGMGAGGGMGVPDNQL